MKTLIETSSPLYLRRMVRELNALPEGFYVRGSIVGSGYNPRCNKASYGNGALTVYARGTQESFDVMPDKVESAFTDAYGRNVCASRHA